MGMDRCVDRNNGDGRYEQCLKKARKLFHRFHCFPGLQVMRAPCRRTMPNVLVHLGSLQGVIYRSDKGSLGRPKTYIHFMEAPPQLVCNPEGTQLYIIGGRYRVTRRGIEG
jgi:hypothetical protein